MHVHIWRTVTLSQHLGLVQSHVIRVKILSHEILRFDNVIIPNVDDGSEWPHGIISASVVSHELHQRCNDA